MCFSKKVYQNDKFSDAMRRRDSSGGTERVVTELCSQSWGFAPHGNREVAMPSVEALRRVVEVLRSVLFPGYFGDPRLNPSSLRYRIGAALDEVLRLLEEQIARGLRLELGELLSERQCRRRARQAAEGFLEALPAIRTLLATDVEAAYLGDPAAKSPGEVILCYPSLRALTNYRIAHRLYELGVPLIPRIITEMAHSETGIDIHPGAQIGERFFMDHGTGIVIGETSIIGRNVRVYQGVTLGAKSFPLDEEGHPIKGIPRHPIVEDDVIIYAGATILGRVRIGRGSVIGGNVWVTEDVPAGSRIVQATTREERFIFGEGI